MDRYDMHKGQAVTLRHPTRGRMPGEVMKVNPKNTKVKMASDGRTWNCPHYMLEKATVAEETLVRDAASSALPSARPPVVGTFTPVLGEVVKFKGAAIPVHKRGLFVVLGSHSDKYRLARLGGDKNRYIRGVLARNIERVEFDLAGV